MAEKKDDLWGFAKEKNDLALELRRPYEREWLLGLAFLAGRQNSAFSNVTHSIQYLKPVPGRVRMVQNLLLPKWRRQVADLVSTRPEMSVVPNSNDEEDIAAAKTGDKVIRAFWQNDSMKKKIRLLAVWMYGTGNAFLDDRWDPKKGPTTYDEKRNLVYLGDATCGVWSPFEVGVPFVNYGDTDLHEFPWITKMKFRPLSWIAGNYPRGKEVTEEEIPTQVADMGLLVGGGASIATSKYPGALVIELYYKPDLEYPKGLFVTAANGIVLNRQDFPFDSYNLEQFKDLDFPGVFWGSATLFHGIGAQRTWNRTVSDTAEYNRTMARGKWLNPKGSGVAPGFSNAMAEEISYKPVMGHKPELLTLKGLPNSYPMALETSKAYLNELFSQHEVTQGTNRSDLRSGEMVALLREQDAMGGVPTHAVFEESAEKVMSRVLRRIQMGYGTERMLKVQGKEGEFDVFSFKGADLRNNTDVLVKRQSSLPDSRVARQAQVLERFQVGLYGNPADPDVRRNVMNLLDDAVVKDIYEEARWDESVARWENRTMAQGVTIIPNTYDNHEVHSREHKRFLKASPVQKLKVEKPDDYMGLFGFFGNHIAVHDKAIMERMQQMVAMQAQLGGKGGR